MIKNTILSLIVILVMGACGGSSNSSYNPSAPDASTEVVVINGYTLPPEPDPVVNDSTILGIDSNDNGVRDDVEIWLLEKKRGQAT